MLQGRIKNKQAFAALFALSLAVLFPALSFAVDSNPFCPANPSPSFMDVLLEPPVGAGSTVSVFLYNITGNDYVKTAVPGGLIINVDQSDKSNPHLCYGVTNENGVSSFTYDSEADGCVDYWFIFCPLTDAVNPGAARQTCLNGTKMPQALINSNMPSCGSVADMDASTSRYLPSINQFYQCNQKPSTYAGLCWPLMLILGLLLGASFLAGKNPFMAFDFSAPRMNRGRQYAMRNQNRSFDITSALMIGADKAGATATGGKKTNLVTGALSNLLEKGVGKLEAIAESKMDVKGLESRGTSGSGSSTGTGQVARIETAAKVSKKEEFNKQSQIGQNDAVSKQMSAFMTSPDLKVLFGKEGVPAVFKAIYHKWATLGDNIKNAKFERGSFAADLFKERSDRFGGYDFSSPKAAWAAQKKAWGNYLHVWSMVFSRLGKAGENKWNAVVGILRDMLVWNKDKEEQGLKGAAKETGALFARMLIGVVKLYSMAQDFNNDIKAYKGVAKGLGISSMSNKEANTGIRAFDALDNLRSGIYVFGREMSVGELANMLNADPRAYGGPLSMLQPSAQYLRDKAERDSLGPVKIALNGITIGGEYTLTSGMRLFDMGGNEIIGKNKEDALDGMFGKSLWREKSYEYLGALAASTKNNLSVEPVFLTVDANGVARKATENEYARAVMRMANAETLSGRMALHLMDIQHGLGYMASEGHKRAVLFYEIIGRAEDYDKGKAKLVALLDSLKENHELTSDQTTMLGRINEVYRDENAAALLGILGGRSLPDRIAEQVLGVGSILHAFDMTFNESDFRKMLNATGQGYRNALIFRDAFGGDVSEGRQAMAAIIEKLGKGVEFSSLSSEERAAVGKITSSTDKMEIAQALHALSKSVDESSMRALENPQVDLHSIYSSSQDRLKFLGSSLQILKSGRLDADDRVELMRNEDAYLLNIHAEEQKQAALRDFIDSKFGMMGAIRRQFELDKERNEQELGKVERDLADYERKIGDATGRMTSIEASIAHPPSGADSGYVPQQEIQLTAVKEELARLGDEKTTLEMNRDMLRTAASATPDQAKEFLAATDFFLQCRKARYDELDAQTKWVNAAWASGTDMTKISASIAASQNWHAGSGAGLSDGEIYIQIKDSMDRAFKAAKLLNTAADSLQIANGLVSFKQQLSERGLLETEQLPDESLEKIFKESARLQDLTAAAMGGDSGAESKLQLENALFKEKYSPAIVSLQREDVAGAVKSLSAAEDFARQVRASQNPELEISLHKLERLTDVMSSTSYEGSPVLENREKIRVWEENVDNAKNYLEEVRSKVLAGTIDINATLAQLNGVEPPLSSENILKKIIDGQTPDSKRGINDILEEYENKAFRSSLEGVDIALQNSLRQYREEQGILAAAYLNDVYADMLNQARGATESHISSFLTSPWNVLPGFEQGGIEVMNLHAIENQPKPAVPKTPDPIKPDVGPTPAKQPEIEPQKPLYIFLPLTGEGSQATAAYKPEAPPTNQWETKKDLDIDRQMDVINATVEMLRSRQIIMLQEDEDRIRNAVHIDRDTGQVYIDQAAGLDENVVKSMKLMSQLSATRTSGLMDKALGQFSKQHGMDDPQMTTEQRAQVFVENAHDLVDAMANIKVKRYTGDEGVYLSKKDKQWLHNYIDGSLGTTTYKKK